MHGVCDYTSILMGRMGPGPAIDKPLSFSLGSNAVLDVHSILTFTVKVESGPADIQITINELGVAQYKLSDYFGTLNKIVPPNVLQHGTNRMRFNVTAEDYLLIFFEDVALWWFKNSLE